MRSNPAKTIATILLAVILSTANIYASSESTIMEWYGNQNFSFQETNNSLDVSINKNPWESFTLKISNNEILNNPVVNIDIRSDENITLRVDISDGVFMSSNSALMQQELQGTKMFNRMSFDFTEILKDIELSEEAFLIFIINPGEKFNGELSIRSVNFSTSNEIDNSVESQNEELSVFPSPATSFTNVVIPDGNFETLRILDMTGKIVIEKDVTYYSGTTYRIELDQVSTGYYVVQLASEITVLTNKLIVN